MSRLLGLAVLAVLIWLVLEATLVRLRLSRLSVKTAARPVQAPPETIAATLVRCAGCGVHVPRESLVGGRCEQCSQASTL